MPNYSFQVSTAPYLPLSVKCGVDACYSRETRPEWASHTTSFYGCAKHVHCPVCGAHTDLVNEVVGVLYSGVSVPQVVRVAACPVHGVVK